MEFEFSEEQKAFRREFRAWLAENLPPGWQEGEGQLPDDQEERETFLRNWQRTLAEGNWAGPHWPAEFGGRGASEVEHLIYEQELARVRTPPKINAIGINFVGPALIEEGTEDQKRRYLPRILDARDIWCQGYSEPEAGSDVASLTTRAEQVGEEFHITGQKIWTTFAHYADWCMLMTRTDDSGTKHEGITGLIVDMDQPGVTTEPIHQVTDERRFNQLYFDDAVAPVENVVGTIDEGWDVIRTISAFEHAGSRIFDIERRWEEICEFCETTDYGGEPLITQPWVRRGLADFYVRIQATKLAHYRNVTRQCNRDIPGPEGSLNRVMSDELFVELEEFQTKLLGPQASLWEDGPKEGSLMTEYLATYGAWVAAGTGDIQRNIIAEHVLGLPPDPKSDTSHRGESG